MLDTSFVVEALVSSQLRHRRCLDYLVRLAEEHTEVVYSSLLPLELRETAFQLALKERHPKDWRRFRHDGRARPRAAALMRQVDEAWSEIADIFDAGEIPIEHVADDVADFMSAYGLASYDAIHAATAVLRGPGVIVTLDVGFSSVPAEDLSMYIDNSRVARCREIRSR